MIYKLSEVPDHLDTIAYITERGGFHIHGSNDSIKNYTFQEFTLEELGLPTAQELLQRVLELEKEIGLQGWKIKGSESLSYRGFSLAYNPDFLDKDVSIFHQSMGSDNLTQSYGKKINLGTHTQVKNTYYDSYAFRLKHELIENHLGFFLNKFRCSLVRSRVAFFNKFCGIPNDAPMHQDEIPFQLFRINIPLQTSEEYILELKGTDEYGNEFDLVKHLELGKVYFWNTRIPHRVDINKPCFNPKDRIHLVLGFSPWFDYDQSTDSFVASDLHGVPIDQIISKKLFLK